MAFQQNQWISSVDSSDVEILLNQDDSPSLRTSNRYSITNENILLDSFFRRRQSKKVRKQESKSWQQLSDDKGDMKTKITSVKSSFRSFPKPVPVEKEQQRGEVQKRIRLRAIAKKTRTKTITFISKLFGSSKCKSSDTKFRSHNRQSYFAPLESPSIIFQSTSEEGNTSESDMDYESARNQVSSSYEEAQTEAIETVNSLNFDVAPEDIMIEVPYANSGNFFTISSSDAPLKGVKDDVCDGSHASSISGEQPFEYNLENGFRKQTALMMAKSIEIIESISSRATRDTSTASICFLLVMDPWKKLFEFVTFPYDNDNDVVADVITRLPALVTDKRLSKLQFAGISCNGMFFDAPTVPLGLILQGYTSTKPLVAVPQNISCSDVETLANALLHMPEVAQAYEEQRKTTGSC